jgi:hypothetical protein
VDDDCTVTDYSSCCACCPSAAYASPKGDLAKKKQSCDPKKCPPCAEGIECPAAQGPKASALVARCNSGACAAVAK